LLGTLDGKDGISVIVGTGTIANAKIGNRIQRISGWGCVLGDEGSGYWIGKQMLSVFTKQADGRVEKSLLYETIRSYFELTDDYDCIRILNSNGDTRGEIAKLAKVCDTLANLKDKYCVEILEAAAKEVSLSITGLQKYFKDTPMVSYYGSVFHSEIFLKALQSYASGVVFVKPKHNARYGAYLYVKEKYKAAR
jgi:N-acetylglucosamine kinase-like BadF-type ATPase